MNARPQWFDWVARTRLASYLLAVVLVLVTLSGRLPLGAELGGPTLIVFTIPIIVSAYLGGVGPGVVATVASVCGATYFLLAPVHSSSVNRRVDSGSR